MKNISESQLRKFYNSFTQEELFEGIMNSVFHEDGTIKNKKLYNHFGKCINDLRNEEYSILNK
jgi:hypothetical protein